VGEYTLEEIIARYADKAFAEDSRAADADVCEMHMLSAEIERLRRIEAATTGWAEEAKVLEAEVAVAKEDIEFHVARCYAAEIDLNHYRAVLEYIVNRPPGGIEVPEFIINVCRSALRPAVAHTGATRRPWGPKAARFRRRSRRREPIYSLSPCNQRP
jgi:hypothetical protein